MLLALSQSHGFIDDNLRVHPEHKSDFFAVFHGDLVDRGPNGIETLAIVIAFRLANPSNVFVARGNHESRELNENGGFASELAVKYADASESDLDRIYSLYDTLPAAVLLGAAPAAARENGKSGGHPRLLYVPSATRFLLCVHGGLELGFDPLPLLLSGAGDPASALAGAHAEFDAPLPLVQYALISALRRGDWLSAQPPVVRKRVPVGLRGLFVNQGDLPRRTQTSDEVVAEAAEGPEPFSQWTLGFMWNDFFVHDTETFLGHSRGRGFIFGRDLTRHWLDEDTRGLVVGVVRAHQHNDARASGPMLSAVRAARGVFDNWGASGLVVTLLSGGSIPGMAFPFDSFALLSVPSEDASTWRMEACGQRTEQPFIWRRGQWAQLAGDATGATSARSELPPDWAPRAQRVCSPGLGAMTCSLTPWRVGGAGAASGSGEASSTTIAGRSEL